MNEEQKTSRLGALLQQLQADDQQQPATLSQENIPAINKDDEIIDLGMDFDFDNYQVVRREFFAHSKEPSATFNDLKFYVNAACLAKFTNFNYAQVLINQEKRILALRPCEENEKDSFMWCNTNSGKRKPKPITCNIFFAKIVALMNWEPKYRYRLLGKLIHANGEYLIAFDLSAVETYQRTYREGEKPKMSRTPIFPAEWKNQFGLPFNEHRQSMQVNVFDGYAIYSIKDNEEEQAQEVANNE